jgi:hypothetical protein
MVEDFIYDVSLIGRDQSYYEHLLAAVWTYLGIAEPYNGFELRMEFVSFKSVVESSRRPTFDFLSTLPMWKTIFSRVLFLVFLCCRNLHGWHYQDVSTHRISTSCFKPFNTLSTRSLKSVTVLTGFSSFARHRNCLRRSSMRLTSSPIKSISSEPDSCRIYFF